MKTIGIVGGIAPASTIEYYKYLIDAYRRSSPGGAYPSIVINSIDPRRMLGMMEAGDMSGTVEYLVSALRVLADAGVALALFASNTPHLLFDDIRSHGGGLEGRRQKFRSSHRRDPHYLSATRS